MNICLVVIGIALELVSRFKNVKATKLSVLVLQVYFVNGLFMRTDITEDCSVKPGALKIQILMTIIFSLSIYFNNVLMSNIFSGFQSIIISALSITFWVIGVHNRIYGSIDVRLS